jgi:hypothetical protein
MSPKNKAKAENHGAARGFPLFSFVFPVFYTRLSKHTMNNMSNDYCPIDMGTRHQLPMIRQTLFARLVPSSLQPKVGEI